MIYLAVNRVALDPAFGHLQLVHDGMEIEVQAPTLFFLGADWIYEYRSHDGITDGTEHTSGNVNGVIDPLIYGSVAINIGNRDAGELWNVLRDIQIQFEQQTSIDYDISSQNSNSFINTLLYMIGLDSRALANAAVPGGGPISGPGIDTNVLLNPDIAPNFTLTLTASDDILRTGFGNDFVDGGDGDDKIYTFGGNDTLVGGIGNDILLGGSGNDVIIDDIGNDVMFGGDDDDRFIVGIDFIDDGGGEVEGGEGQPAREINGYDLIDGGAGRDTLETSGTVYRLTSGDFALADEGRVTDIIRNVEVIEGAEILDLSASTEGIHFDGDHSFTFGEDLVEIYGLFEIMGSQGSDTMTANEDIWLIHGGDGDDQLFGGEVIDFRLTGGRGNDLIEGGDGFADGGDGDDIITLESGEARGGDGNDIITITGSGIMDGGAGSDVLSGGFGSVASGDANDTLTIGGISITGNGRVFSTLGNFAYGIVRENLFEQDWVLMVRPVLIQPTFDGTQSSIMWQGFLVSNVSEAILDENGWYNGTSDGIVYFRMGDFGLQTEALGYDTGMGAARITYTDPVTGQRVTRFISDLPVGNLAGSDTTWPDYYENAELSIDGDFNWDGADGFGGGTTSDTDNGSNIRSGDGNLRLSNFDPSRQTLVVNGVALSASTLATGMTATEVAGSTVIQYGQSETITLSGVSLADWTTGSAAQIHGAAGDDELTGTSAADVIASGGGNDTMTGGNGDDLFIYTSGHDVIIGHNNNKGNDTLDLSQYSAADVTFAVSGNHVLITTPDGSITLQDQVRNEIGNFRSNIETVLFSDGTLDEAGIRDRALVDQMTSGDDIITGTQHADTLNGGNGNDTIYGGNGDDTFIYTAGHDLIHGHGFNGGNDTLVLSQYNAADVTFSVLGNNVLITTPDGSITLGDQVRNEIGNFRSNIETVLFSDGILDDAGIRTRAVSDATTGGSTSSPANAIAVVSTTDSGDMGGNDSFVFLPDASPDLPPPLRHVYDDGLSAWLQGSVKGLGHSARLPASDLQADHHETGALLAAIFAADSLSASQYELL